MTHAGAADLQAAMEQIESTQLVVRQIIADFVHSSVEDIDRCVDIAFERLGSFLDIDRVYSFEVFGDAVDNTHEWCAEGIDAEMHNLQGLSLDFCADWLERFALDEEIIVADVAALPPERQAEREILEPQGIQSLLVVPLRAQGETLGFLGFDAVRSTHLFSPVEVGLLRSLADVITSAVIRKRANEIKLEAEGHLRAMTRYGADHSVLVDAGGSAFRVSESWQVLGLEPDRLIGLGWWSLIPAALHDQVRVMLAAACNGFVDHRRETLDISTVLEGSGPAWLEIVFHDLPDDPGIEGAVMYVRDVTNRKLAEEDRAIASLTDSLTGLGSRIALEAVLDRVIDEAKTSGTQVGLLFVDLDRFKLINDSHGHAIGDLLLAKVGERLRQAVRHDTFLARFGGDEFVVVIERVSTFHELDIIAARLQEAVRQPIDVGEMRLSVTASIGIASSGDSTAPPGLLLRDADIAMYRARTTGAIGLRSLMKRRVGSSCAATRSCSDCRSLSKLV